MNEKTGPSEPDKYKELEYRREKQWKIFSWGSTLLVAITGGVVALAWRPDHPIIFTCLQAVIVSGAIVTLALYAELWLDHNWKRENEIAGNLGFKTIEPFFGYTWAIGLLAAAALAAVWVHR